MRYAANVLHQCLSAIFKARLSENPILETVFLHMCISLSISNLNVEKLCSKRCTSALGISGCVVKSVFPGVVILLTAKSDKSWYAAKL